MRKVFRLVGIAMLLAVIVAVGYGITHTRQVLDYIALYNYSPPSEVVVLANKTTMEDEVKNVFYVNRPELQNKSEFSSSCNKQEETIVLGCFIENTGIFFTRCKR